MEEFVNKCVSAKNKALAYSRTTPEIIAKTCLRKCTPCPSSFDQNFAAQIGKQTGLLSKYKVFESYEITQFVDSIFVPNPCPKAVEPPVTRIIVTGNPAVNSGITMTPHPEGDLNNN